MKNPELFTRNWNDPGDKTPVAYTEITLRDLFALAIASALASSERPDKAAESYRQADALLAHRGRE